MAKLSSSFRPHVPNASLRIRSSLSTTDSCLKSTRVAAPTATAIRHASSSTVDQFSASPTASPSTLSQTLPSDNSAFPSLDTITLDNIDLNTLPDISAIPEQIGYLSQIGINFGFGPTSAIQWLLEHIHIYGDLPWWASIVGTAIAIRAATFPLYLKASDTMARQSALASVTKPVMDKLSAAQKAGNTQEVMLAYQQLGAIRKRAGIKLSNQFSPIMVQGVLGYCSFKLMRTMCKLPVPGLHDGGFLWLQDLTMTDGYLLMPLLMAASVHLLIRMGGETGSSQLPAGTQSMMLWGMPALIGVVTAFQPGAVCLWFAGSGAFGIGQALLLRNPEVRKFFNLAPLYKPAAGEGATSVLSAMMEDRLGKSSKPSGKAGAPTRMEYQAPNIRTQPSSRTIDVTLVKPSSTRTASSSPSPAANPDMVQPGASSTGSKTSSGIFSSISRSFDKIRTSGKDLLAKSEEQRELDKKKAFKRRAEAYEREAQKRGR